MGLGTQNRVERSYQFTVTITDCVFRVLPWTVGKSQACWWVTSINIHFPLLWYVSMYYPHFCFHIANFERGTYTPAMRVEMQQTQLCFFLTLGKIGPCVKVGLGTCGRLLSALVSPPGGFLPDAPQGVNWHSSLLQGKKHMEAPPGQTPWSELPISACLSLSWENLAANKPSCSPSSRCNLSAAKYGFSSARAGEQPTAPAYYREVVTSAYFRCRQFPL